MQITTTPDPSPYGSANPAGQIDQADVGNELLRRLDPAAFALLQPHLRREPLIEDQVVASAGEPVELVCFPEGGVVGLADVLTDGRRLAIGLVGREGFLGWPILMGSNRWPHDAVARAQNSTAIWLDSSRLLEALATSPSLRDLLLRFVTTIMAQMARTIVSNLIQSVECRTARWILLYHDRVLGDEVTITHEELGIMLGVRRSSVTDALHELEGKGAIKGLRGRLVIRDRTQLQALAGEAYGFPEAEYQRLIAS